MTREFQHDPLDDLLRQWAEANRSSQGRLDQLEQRIVAQLEALDTHEKVALATRDQARFWRVVSLVAIGTTLLLIVAWGWSWFSQPGHDEEPLAKAPQYILPALSNTELANKRILVAELDRVFDRRFAWIVETDREVYLGVDQGDGHLDDAVPIVVRVVVIRRKTNQTEWERVWSADVVSHSEQLIELSPTSGSDTQLLIWAYALPDGMIAVDGELRLTGDESIQPAFSELNKSGEAGNVFTTKLGDTEYQVFQTVELLDGGVI